MNQFTAEDEKSDEQTDGGSNQKDGQTTPNQYLSQDKKSILLQSIISATRDVM